MPSDPPASVDIVAEAIGSPSGSPAGQALLQIARSLRGAAARAGIQLRVSGDIGGDGTPPGGGRIVIALRCGKYPAAPPRPCVQHPFMPRRESLELARVVSRHLEKATGRPWPPLLLWGALAVARGSRGSAPAPGVAVYLGADPTGLTGESTALQSGLLAAIREVLLREDLSVAPAPPVVSTAVAGPVPARTEPRHAFLIPQPGSPPGTTPEVGPSEPQVLGESPASRPASGPPEAETTRPRLPAGPVTVGAAHPTSLQAPAPAAPSDPTVALPEPPEHPLASGPAHTAISAAPGEPRPTGLDVAPAADSGTTEQPLPSGAAPAGPAVPPEAPPSPDHPLTVEPAAHPFWPQETPAAGGHPAEPAGPLPSPARPAPAEAPAPEQPVSFGAPHTVADAPPPDPGETAPAPAPAPAPDAAAAEPAGGAPPAEPERPESPVTDGTPHPDPVAGQSPEAVHPAPTPEAPGPSAATHPAWPHGAQPGGHRRPLTADMVTASAPTEPATADAPLHPEVPEPPVTPPTHTEQPQIPQPAFHHGQAASEGSPQRDAQGPATRRPQTERPAAPDGPSPTAWPHQAEVADPPAARGDTPVAPPVPTEPAAGVERPGHPAEDAASSGHSPWPHQVGPLADAPQPATESPGAPSEAALSTPGAGSTAAAASPLPVAPGPNAPHAQQPQPPSQHGQAAVEPTAPAEPQVRTADSTVGNEMAAEAQRQAAPHPEQPQQTQPAAQHGRGAQPARGTEQAESQAASPPGTAAHDAAAVERPAAAVGSEGREAAPGTPTQGEPVVEPPSPAATEPLAPQGLESAEASLPPAAAAPANAEVPRRGESSGGRGRPAAGPGRAPDAEAARRRTPGGGRTLSKAVDTAARSESAEPRAADPPRPAGRHPSRPDPHTLHHPARPAEGGEETGGTDGAG